MITYSKAMSKDLDTISELFLNTFSSTFERMSAKTPNKEIMRDVFELYLDCGVLLVARNNKDKLVGFMCGVKNLRELWRTLFSPKWFWLAWKFIFTERTRFISPPKLRFFIDSHLIAEGVHPDYRRRGIAEKLAKLAIAELEKQGAKTFHFETLADNIPIIHLYEKLGFHKGKTFKAHKVEWQTMVKTL